MASDLPPENQQAPLTPALASELRALREKQAALERTVQDLTRALAEARELQQNTAEKQNSRIQQLEWRSNHLQHLVEGILRSRVWRTLTGGGAWMLHLHSLVQRLRTRSTAPVARRIGFDRNDYARWIAEFESQDASLVRLKLSSFTQKPLISILLPVYQTPPEILEATLDSVLRQSYPEWELCIVDDGSQSPDLDALLARYAAGGRRIKIARLPANQGISAASNAALDLATGEFVALLDHDDQLAPDALYHFVDALNREPSAGLFYSDEDQIDAAGARHNPFFKPDWSPDLILSENYVCHLMIFRRDLCLQAGGFRSQCDLSQDHDILLRMSRLARKIVHIPRILYHWRTALPATASASETRAFDATRRALEDHLEATGAVAKVEPAELPFRWRVRYAIPENQRVTILMPCGGKADVLERCLESVARQTDYPLYEIVVIDNSSGSAVQRVAQSRGVQYFDYRNRPFDFSAMNNAAARQVESPLLLFLNDDTTVITPGWLTAMVELASRPEVGAVGAKLLYPNGTIQHAGVVMGLFGVCGHAFKGFPGDSPGYFDLPHVIRNVSAVTGACLMVPTRLFRECGGFDEAFPVAYQDIDLCLRLQQKGYRVLYTPHAQLYHHEALSKRVGQIDPQPAEIALFRSRWKEIIEHDPFYNPNLTRTAEDYSLRRW